MAVYEFVGGPKDGLRLETSGTYEVRFPVLEPITLPTKVTQIRRFREPLYDIISYYRVGDVYRWEGLIEDAWCDIDVTEELLRQEGPPIRKELRYQVRRHLEELAPDKELGRIVWRVRWSPSQYRFTFRAIVGPRRVERGLDDRTQWRADAI